MKEERYRLTITYKKLRPTYSLYHIRHNLGHADATDYWSQDLSEVGEVFTHVIGPYETTTAVKRERTRVLSNYPFVYIHQPQGALENEGWGAEPFEILDERWELGVVRTDWIELDMGR